MRKITEATQGKCIIYKNSIRKKLNRISELKEHKADIGELETLQYIEAELSKIISKIRESH